MQAMTIEIFQTHNVGADDFEWLMQHHHYKSANVQFATH